ncbi:multiple sugar transport system substrate-binding protein [Enterococcus sp. PF1-24]|uniref:ABC transporter substrate-binding protein n=1 Tax=unclassified Enterococcus TaxID=2608891 RepID=UPI002476F788|nr:MULTISPECIES: sugar ABC transporter substrate-binding protein [unclassified Enterococcus]MDH6364282.1 multiple sugar transport system substrate-binding protein [Enterococcus sp. PFB1-1]MDH6401359.1 multiple sugar transport system substrate-binding protein [Enterococcus sp. PF1-24]
MKLKKIVLGMAAVTTLATLSACGSKEEKSSDGNTTLTFQIWDKNQQPGMEKMAEAFTKENPEIKVKVEVTPWDQYWTKLQASASGGEMADLFWMHPDQVYNFASGDALLDLTDYIADSKLEMADFPSYIGDGFNIEGQQLAIPKDYGTLGLWYNKDLFDQAGVAYPDETWTWDTWMEAAEKLTDKDAGVYGMIAQPDGQNFWYNLVWQNGSDLISKDGKTIMMNDPKTVEALEYGVSFIEKGYSPTTSDQANTTPDQYFESGKAAMMIAGSWMATEYTAIDGLNADVAPMPKNVDRGSVSSGMGYAIANNSKHSEEAWKFVNYMAGAEANLIQAESGAAIPALKDTQEPWVNTFPTINAQVFVDAEAYGHNSMHVSTRDAWAKTEQEYILKIFSQEISVKDGCKEMAEQIQTEIDEALE